MKSQQFFEQASLSKCARVQLELTKSTPYFIHANHVVSIQSNYPYKTNNIILKEMSMSGNISQRKRQNKNKIKTNGLKTEVGFGVSF